MAQASQAEWLAQPRGQGGSPAGTAGPVTLACIASSSAATPRQSTSNARAAGAPPAAAAALRSPVVRCQRVGRAHAAFNTH